MAPDVEDVVAGGMHEEKSLSGPSTCDLALGILHDEIEHEAWLAEFLGHGPSRHYSREGRRTRPISPTFSTRNSESQTRG
jgi:hypothetical protein